MPERYPKPSSEQDAWVSLLAEMGWTFEPVADGWHVSKHGGGLSAWDTTPLKAWLRWKLVNDAR